MQVLLVVMDLPVESLPVVFLLSFDLLDNSLGPFPDSFHNIFDSCGLISHRLYYPTLSLHFLHLALEFDSGIPQIKESSLILVCHWCVI